MSLPRLYADLAYLWPILSPPEDYLAEADVVRDVLREKLGDPASGERQRVLEFGAGGGHTLVHLADGYDCTAVDLSSAMLEHCGALLPSARCVVGDMRDVELGETFDAILIHDAVDYLTTEEDLRATLANAHRHLRPGGVLLLAPTYTRETFADHEVASDHRDADRFDVTYFSYVHDPDPGDTSFELILVYLIRRAGDVRIEHDRHRCGLFPIARWRALVREAGFTIARTAPAEGDAPGTTIVATRKAAKQRA